MSDLREGGERVSLSEEEYQKFLSLTDEEILKRLYRINQSRDAELADHRGRCRTLDILLAEDMDWMAVTIIALIESKSKQG